jgi:hypothetical protein
MLILGLHFYYFLRPFSRAQNSRQISIFEYISLDQTRSMPFWLFSGRFLILDVRAPLGVIRTQESMAHSFVHRMKHVTIAHEGRGEYDA